MIKAVFFDFDYTLYSHRTKKIPKSTIEVLNNLKKEGIKIILATGRNTAEMELFPEYKEIGFDGFILLNGQICLDKDMNTLYEVSFTGEALNSLVTLFNEKSQPVVFIEKDRIYVNYQSPLIDQANGEILCLRHEVGQYSQAPLFLAVAYITREEESTLLGRLPGCALKRWGDCGVDIVVQGIDKVVGIKKFMEIFHLTSDEIMAFGDSDNDCEMLRFVKTGVAMGNGTKRAKEAADFVTSDIDADGIFEFFEKNRFFIG